LEGPSLFLPGETFCDATCRGYGVEVTCNGCVGFRPSCLFSRYGIKPIAPRFHVLKKGISIAQPILRIRYFDSSGLLIDETTDSLSQDFGVNVEIIGTFESDYLGISDELMMIRSTSSQAVYLGPASGVGHPEERRIGDIQASSDRELEIPSKDSFIIAELLRQRIATDDAVTFQFHKSGWLSESGTPNMCKLPCTKAGLNWTIKSDGRMEALDYHPGALQVHIESENVMFRKVVNKICPADLKVLAVSGCYSCGMAAILEISLRSSCLPGPAKVSILNSIEVLTPTVLLNETIQTYRVSFLMDERVTSSEVCVEAETKACVRTDIHLTKSETVNVSLWSNTTETVVQKDSRAAGESGSWWNPISWIENIFKGTAAWWEWILTIILLIAIIALAVLIVPPSIYIAMAAWNWLKMWRARRAKMEDVPYVRQSPSGPKTERTLNAIEMMLRSRR